MTQRHLSIALIGTRGVPANYGGFETCVQEIGTRLAERGHAVTVYCRKSYYRDRAPEWRGVRRVFLPNLHRKTLDTLSHTLLSVGHVLLQPHDVCMVFNAANSPFILPLRLLGRQVAINTDGLEWRRTKWSQAGRLYYKVSETIACLLANRIVADSKGIKDYYHSVHATDSSEIAYGAYVYEGLATDLLARLGLEPQGYFLQITRFEPENHPLLTIQAFKRLATDKKLVLVGGNSYGGEYTARIEGEEGGSVLLPGFIYDSELLRQLWCSCYAYIHGNSVGGTNPALLQAMASGCFTIAVDVPFNRDVLQGCGIYYSPDETSLAERMQWALDNRDALPHYRDKARQRIIEEYSWDRITDQYEALFRELADGLYPWRPSLKVVLSGL